MNPDPVPTPVDLPADNLEALYRRWAELGTKEVKTSDEHLDVIALGAAISLYYTSPALIHDAVMAGASWASIAQASGRGWADLRQEYAEWAFQRFAAGKMPDDEWNCAQEVITGTVGGGSRAVGELGRAALDRAADMLDRINGGR